MSDGEIIMSEYELGKEVRMMISPLNLEYSKIRLPRTKVYHPDIVFVKMNVKV